MPEEIDGGRYAFDFAPALAGLDKLGLADATFRAELKKTGEVGTSAYAAAAKAATDYSDRLAAARGEQAATSAAVRDTIAEVRKLTAAGKDLEAALKKASGADEQKRLQRELEKNTAKIKEAKFAIEENRAAVEAERRAVAGLTEERRKEVNQTKLAAAAAKDAAAATKEQGSAGGGLAGVLGRATAAFAGFFAFNKLKSVASDIIEVTTEFERLDAVLTTIEGGNKSAAQQRFAELRKYAVTAPFEVKEITEAYVLLRNVGINPTIEQIKSLGDLAAASGKSFDTAANGLLGATTGRFVQLKQFGITAKQQGDQVALTFRGVTTVVEKSQQAISEYIFGLGQLNGVLGASDRIAATTGGRISNLKDSMTELFNTIGEGTSGPLNAFIGKLTQLATNIREAIKSTDQRAQDQLADTGALKNYSATLDTLFKKAQEDAKKAGTDIGFAINSIAAQQANLLQKQLEKAQKAVDEINGNTLDPTQVGKNIREQFFKYEDVLDNPEADARFQKELANRKQRLLLIQGEITLTKERAEAAKKGNKEDDELNGLIAKQIELIKNIKERQEKATQENQGAGAEFLFGKGGLNKQLDDAQKELDRLLGKVDKARKAQDDRLARALAALERERATLLGLAEKAAINASEDALTRSRLQFKEDLRQIEILEQKLIERERAVAKAGGRGVNADGKVDGVQERQLQALRDKAARDRLDRDYDAARRLTDYNLSLREESDNKERTLLLRKYEAERALLRDNEEGAFLLKAKYLRDLAALEFAINKRNSEAEAAFNRDNASRAVGEVYGEGTGISIIEAKRNEQALLLEIERKSAQDQIDNAANLEDKLKKGEIEAGLARLARVKNQLKELEDEKSKHKVEDFFYKLVLGERDSGEARQQLEQDVSTIVSSINTVLAADVAAAQARVNAGTQRINELQGTLAAEIQLNKTGAASNIRGILDQIKAEKQARATALREQREAARQQQLINDLTAVSSIISASAKIIEGWSSVPYVGSILGIAAVGAMVAAFAAQKAAAKSAVGNNQGGFFVGGYTGGTDAREERGVVHGKEYVITAAKTAEYRSLLDAIHTGRPLDAPGEAQVRALLPDYGLPGRLQSERAAYHINVQQQSFGPLQAELAGVRSELAEIKASNASMAERPDAIPTPGGYVLQYPNGDTKIVRLVNGG